MNPVLVSAPAAAGNFVPEFPSGYTYGRVWWFNDTPYGHLVAWDTAPTPASGYYVPAFHHRLMTVRQPINQVYYAVPAAATLSGSAATPLTYCRAEFYALDELGTLQDGLWPLNERLSNVGNTPGVTVIANELGTTADGVLVNVPAIGTLTATDEIFPYANSAPANPTRDVGIGAIHAGANVHNILQTITVAGGGPGVQIGGTLVVTIQLSTDGGNLLTDGAGHFNTYGGVATVGGGVPAERGKASGVAVTAITAQTIETLTSPNDGVRHGYRINGRFRLNNGTNGQLITFRITYTDADTLAGAAVYFAGNSGGSGDITFAGSSSVSNGTWSCTPRYIEVAPNTAITVLYTDPANTPADQVSSLIEQLF